TNRRRLFFIVLFLFVLPQLWCAVTRRFPRWRLVASGDTRTRVVLDATFSVDDDSNVDGYGRKARDGGGFGPFAVTQPDGCVVRLPPGIPSPASCLRNAWPVSNWRRRA